MSSLVIVVIKPELELVLDVLEIIVRFDISPIEFTLHRLVEPFDLSVVFRSVRRIHDEFDSKRSKAIPEGFGVESIVRADRLDPSRKLPNEAMDEIYGVFDRVSLVYPGDDQSRAIIDGIDGNNVSLLSEWEACIELNLRPWLIVGIQLRIILPPPVFGTIPDLVAFEDPPDGRWVQGYFVVFSKLLRERKWSKMCVSDSKIAHLPLNPFRSTIVRTSFLRSRLLGDEACSSVPLVLSHQTVE